MEIIGRGERTAVKILKELFPDAEIKTQVPLHKCLTEKWREGLSERQVKESIDILVLRKFKRPLCVRIQDKHHNTERFSRIDKSQQTLLNFSYNDVVDIPELECPHLFNEEFNEFSKEEMLYFVEPYL